MKDRKYLLEQLRHQEWIEEQLRRPRHRETPAAPPVKPLALRLRQPDREAEREACKKCAS